MLDSYIRPLIDPPLAVLARRLTNLGITANRMTFVGFMFGVTGMCFIIAEQYQLAVIAIVLNRLADGLDGAIARYHGVSDFGGFLDITCDFIIYSGIIFAFGLSDPIKLPSASFLIFSFVGPITSFLAYAIIASKRQVNTQKRGKKSFYYLGGMCEGTETAFVLILSCLLPQYFNQICIVFGILCWLTTVGRVYNAWYDFAREERIIDDSSDTYIILEEEPESQAQKEKI